MLLGIFLLRRIARSFHPFRGSGRPIHIPPGSTMQSHFAGPAVQPVAPCGCSPTTGDWAPFEYRAGDTWHRDNMIRIVSWNIDSQAPSQPQRAAAAIVHLKEVFRNPPPSLVIMPQEIQPDALKAILADRWIKEHFLTSHAIADECLVVMLVSKDIPTQQWFQISLGEGLGRKALFIDIPLAPRSKHKSEKEVLRLCNTRLASLKKASQLAYLHYIDVLSQLRKPPGNDISIRGGLVGGHLDFIFRYVGARNNSSFVVWDEADGSTSCSIPYRHSPASEARVVNLTQNDASENEAELQLPPQRSRKFLATGLLELSPLQEVKGESGDIGRIGLGLKTKVEVCKSRDLNVRQSARSKYDLTDTGQKRNNFNLLVSRQHGLALGVKAL
jgi:hypothetical protein